MRVMRANLLTGKDTREKILYLLKTNGQMTVDDLSRELDSSGVNIRRHLDALERDALVESSTQKRERGRPVSLYSLTDRAHELFPQAYDVVSVEILQQVEERFGRDAVCAILHGRAERIIREIKPQIGGKTLKKKVEEFSRIFNEMGYITRVESNGRDEQHTIVVHHCPVLMIARDYPEVCDGDCAIGRDSLEANVERECTLSEGASCCRFWVTQLAAE
jgi:predicted ArsR family transcriptional regulator